jgi:L-seryl-tRNA(Ser) seleniumtransferase
VEIGGSFRVPEVIEQSGARLVDVGTTNRTRLADYATAIGRPGVDAAIVLKVHPSNYRVNGFVEATSVAELSELDVPVVVDIGSGLIDATCPWLRGGPPAWLVGEPAARQTLAAGASIVTFSGDKLFGGPQAGIIVGRRDLVERCRRHPLARALRPGGLVMDSLQQTALALIDRDVDRVPFWRMVATPVEALEARATQIAAELGDDSVRPAAMEAVPGAGSAPGVTMASFGLAMPGDHRAGLRAHPRPVIARSGDGLTMLDLRAVDPADDATIVAALRDALAVPAR